MMMFTIFLQPEIDFGMSVLGGDVMSLPGLYHLVQRTIKMQVSSLYLWPQSLEIPILDPSTMKRGEDKVDFVSPTSA
ncbi:hypothetical protein V6N13_030029 [Hibiscus sabdariffa]